MIYFDRYFDTPYNLFENNLEIDVVPSLRFSIPEKYGSFKARIKKVRDECGKDFTKENTRYCLKFGFWEHVQLNLTDCSDEKILWL